MLLLANGLNFYGEKLKTELAPYGSVLRPMAFLYDDHNNRKRDDINNPSFIQKQHK